MIPIGDFFTNLAVELAYDLLRTGAARLKTFVQGSPEEQALRRCYEAAFAAMLEKAAAGLNADQRALAEDILRQFVAQPTVAETLLDLALAGAETPDLPALRAAFDALDFDRDTLPVDFDAALTAFQRGLATALLDEAGQAGSPLFNRVNLGRVLAVQALLQAQRHTLDEIVRQVRQLESRGGAVYNFIIAQATGVAIGDMARVEQALPPDVYALLREILDALRPTLPDTAELLAPYLDWLIRQHSTLELRGIRRAGPSPVTPLEEVYAALQAETAPEAEWQESRRLLEEEVTAWLDSQGLTDLSDAERRRLRWRFLAGHPLMPALAERDRPRLFPERRGETLHLAEAVRRYRWLVILGDPGSGKTTLLRWLTLRLARALRDGAARVLVPAVHVDPSAEEDAPTVDLGPARLPVLVRVADYAEARRQAAKEGRPPPTLYEFLGHQGWQGQFPTFGREHPRQGERIPPDGLHRLIGDWLRRGQAVVLLDGLDEITAAADRTEIVGAVEAFLRDWVADPLGYSPLDRPDQPWPGRVLPTPADQGGNQLILTSRIAGYHDAPLSGRLTHATIQPMSDPAVDRFCRTWTAAVHRLLAAPHDSEAEIQERAKNEADALIRAVHDPNRPGLRELAGNPLLLTILAMVHHNSQARLPEQRVRLYQIAVENLVEVWRDTGLNEEEVVQVLAPVAAHIHQNYPTGLIEEAELRDQVTRALAEYRGEDPDRPTPASRRDVANFLQAVRERVGLLAARGEALYGFLHLTFQEYLAARHLAGDPDAALAAILERRDDPRWREPILLALGYLSQPQSMAACTRLLRALLEADDPLDDLLPRGALLVAAALPEMVKAPLAVVEEIVRRLLRAWAALPYAWLREEVSRTLERLRRGDEAPLADRVLIEALTAPPPADAPDPAAAAAALIRQHRWFTRDLAEALLAALPRDRADEGWPITLALADLAVAQPDTLPNSHLPFRRALRDEPALARRVADDPHWLRLILALYGGLDERGAFDPRCLHRDSPLTADLLAALGAGGPAADLLPGLRQRVATESGVARADACLALAVLGAPQEAACELLSVEERHHIAGRAAFLAARVRGKEAAIARALAALAPHLAGHPDLLAEALRAAAAIADPDDRARALADLAPHLAGHPDLLAEALRAAAAIADEFYRTRALAALAPHLAEPERTQALAEALRAAAAITAPYARAHALAALAPGLAGHPDLLAEALRAAAAITAPDARARALADLAPHLAGHPDLLAEALRAAAAIADEFYRTRALAALAPHLAEPERTQALAEALRAAAAITAPYARAHALAALAPGLAGHPDLLAEALRAAAAIADEFYRARALAALAPGLAGYPDLLAEALRAAAAIADEFYRARALAALAPHLAGHPDLLAEALRAAAAIAAKGLRADALAALAPHLAEPERTQALAEALRAAAAIADEFYRTRALADLAPHLAGHPDLLAEALRAAADIATADDRARALAALAPGLAGHPDLLAEALRAAAAIADASYRADALAALAPHLAGHPDLLAEALRAAAAIATADDRARALAALAPHLAGHPDLLAEALRAAAAIAAKGLRADALADLAPHLAGHPDLLAEALRAAAAIAAKGPRADALAALAPHLAEPERTQALAEALRAAAAIADPDDRARALAVLALHLAEPERTQALAEALRAAAAIADPDDRADALADLAPHLAGHPDLLAEALRAAAAIADEFYRTRALAALAPHLAEPERTQALAEALRAAAAIADEFYRTRALAALAPHLAGHPDLLAEALRAAAAITAPYARAHALAALAPGLAGHPDLLAEALRAAAAITAPDARAHALAALAPGLAGYPDLLAEALRAAAAIADEFYRARALAALAPHLAGHPDLLAEALRAAAAIATADDRARALAALAPHLAGHPDLLAEALRAAAAIAAKGLRADALADLAPHLAGHPDLLAEALRLLHAIVAPLSALSALLPLTGLLFVWPETPSARWAALARAADAPAEELTWFITQTAERAAEKGLSYTAEAAAALEALLGAGRVDAVAALLPLLQEPTPEALRQAETWSNDPGTGAAPLRPHAALLLAEAGRLSPASLSHLLALWQTGPDRSRCRAALALYGRSKEQRLAVSALGRETVEALAALYLQHHAEPQVGTALDWALKALLHDDPALLAAWAADLAAGREEAEAILGGVHNLTPSVWAVMEQHLRAGPPAVQAALLASLAWLLRLGNLPEEALPQARAILHDLGRQGEGKVRRAAVAALGCLPSPRPEDYQALLPLRAESADDARVRALALARLGARLPAAERAPVEAALREALADPLWARPAAGGLVRLYLADAEGEPQDFDPAPLLEWLLGPAPVGLGLAPEAALAALLAAGADDDAWGAYHERVVRAARTLIVARPDDLFALLLAHLEEALTEADDWPPRRIALAVTAAAAEALPAHFRRRADPRRLERRLVQAARDAESFSTRRFALTALSHLRRVTPAVAGALLAALRDVGDVQQDALAAAERFRLAEGDIVPALAAALKEESAATAYAAAQVLAALRPSAEAAERRPAIIQALAAALRAPGARRGVYVLDEEQEIKYLDRLDEALYRALVQVTGAGGKVRPANHNLYAALLRVAGF